MDKEYRTDKKDTKQQWRDAAVFNLTMLAAALGYMALMVRTGIFCPIRHFTGIPCAGCGMSRALGCLLRLDIAGSLSNNPALVPCLIAVFFMINRETVILSRLSMRVKDTVIFAGLGFTAVSYLIRIVFFGIP